MSLLRPLLLVTLILGGCRDTEPFILARPDFSDELPRRLTFNVEDDRAPSWNATADSLYVAAHGYPPFPARPGIVIALPVEGGDARIVMPQIQIAAQPPLLAASAFGGPRIAFTELTRFVPYDCAVTCPGLPEGFDLSGAHPELEEARIRIRNRDAAAGQDAHTFPVGFAGAVHDSTRHPFNLEFVHVHTAYPFQKLYSIYRDPFFRPTLSADGESVIFSDGLRLRRWQPGSVTAPAIANTQNGVWPALSPDGQTIAFTRLRSQLLQQITCYCFTLKGEVASLYETTLYANPGRIGMLVVMRADGTQPRDLGDGTAPAWTPDGRHVVVARTNGLYAVNVASGAATLIPETANGFEPAVSPDGKLLAFARETAAGNHDIWIVPLNNALLP